MLRTTTRDTSRLFCLVFAFVLILKDATTNYAEDFQSTVDRKDHLWVSLASLPLSHNAATATTSGSRAFLLGDRDYLLSYDFATDTWTTKSRPPQKQADACSVEFGTKLFFVGGSHQKDFLQEYSFATDAWTLRTRMPGDAKTPGCDVIGSALFVLPEDNNVFWKYSFDTDSWTRLRNSPTTNTDVVKAAVVLDTLFVVGDPRLFKYSPSTDLWSLASARAVPDTQSKDFAFATSNGHLYLVSGGDNKARLQDYHVLLDVWTIRANIPSDQDTTAAFVSENFIYLAGGGDTNKLHRFTAWAKPQVTAVAVSNFPSSGGVSITINGQNFLDTRMTPTVWLASSPCLTSSWRSDTTILCLGPSGTGNGLRVVVRTEIKPIYGTAVDLFSFNAGV